VEEAVTAARVGDRNSADALRAAAEVLLAQAAHAAPGRDTALALLAADALMTYACEATAEQTPDKLGEMH
jgi:hypothetical protein